MWHGFFVMCFYVTVSKGWVFDSKFISSKYENKTVKCLKVGQEKRFTYRHQSDFVHQADQSVSEKNKKPQKVSVWLRCDARSYV